MGALHAFRTVPDDEQPLYDSKAPAKRRHLTIIDDNVVDYVIEQCGFTAAGIYTLMERRANRDGLCRNLSYASIADRGGLSRRQAIRIVQQLVDAGFVEVRPVARNGGRGENEFFLPGHLSAPLGGDTPANINAGVVTSGGDIPSDMGGDTTGDINAGGGDTGSDMGGDTLYRLSNHVSTPSSHTNDDAGETASPSGVPDDYVLERRFSPADTLDDRYRLAAIELDFPLRLVEAEFGEFKDYWLSASGPSSYKLDWIAAWRGHLRRQFKRQGIDPVANQRIGEAPRPAWESRGLAL